jgi:hypothetical protein
MDSDTHRFLSFALLGFLSTACGGDRGPARMVPVEEPVRRVAVRNGVPVYRKVILSPTYTIDRIYRSMRGPYSVHRFEMDGGEPGLLWITAFDAVMAGPDGATPVSQEFMCHTNLSIRPGPGNLHLFPGRLQPSGGRLFSLAQGQMSARLPDGFGVPVLSDQTLQLTTQVLNHNAKGEPFEVRHRISIEFVRDADLGEPLVPLVPRAVFGMKLLEGRDGLYGVPSGETAPGEHAESCLVGQDVRSPFASLLTDPSGRSFTGHWVLPPGPEVNRTYVTRLLDLPYDTTLHYAAVHLHPFATAIELRDLTAGATVVRSLARNLPDRIGLAEVQDYSSREGLAVRRDHEYEVVSEYDNTSGAEQDSMATVFLYLTAKDLDLSPWRRGATAARIGRERVRRPRRRTRSGTPLRRGAGGGGSPAPRGACRTSGAPAGTGRPPGGPPDRSRQPSGASTPPRPTPGPCRSPAASSS